MEIALMLYMQRMMFKGKVIRHVTLLVALREALE